MWPVAVVGFVICTAVGAVVRQKSMLVGVETVIWAEFVRLEDVLLLGRCWLSLAVILLWLLLRLLLLLLLLLLLMMMMMVAVLLLLLLMGLEGVMYVGALTLWCIHLLLLLFLLGT
jgi:hypothetical protein